MFLKITKVYKEIVELIWRDANTKVLYAQLELNIPRLSSLSTLTLRKRLYALKLRFVGRGVTVAYYQIIR